MKSKKMNKLQFLISVTALLLIALIGAGVTYSWIEGGTTYTIKTDKNGDVNTGDKPVSDVVNSLTIDPASSNTIDLGQFDQNTNKENLYFSPVSSADGVNFYLPTAYDTDTTDTTINKAKTYRKANTNDVGTKFINYNFDITAAKKCYLAFNGEPKITATKNSMNLDTSSFRIMLKCGDDTKILTTSDDSVTTKALDENGDEVEYTADPVRNYLNGTNPNKLFDFAANDTGNIEVSIWLDEEAANPELLGSAVNVDMQLIAAQESFKTKIYVEPRTGFSSYYAYTHDTAETVFDYGGWPGTIMSRQSDTGYYYASKEITDSCNFIVNAGSNSTVQYPASGSSTKLTIDTTQEPDANGYLTYVLLADGTWRTFDDTKITTNAQAVTFNSDGVTVEENAATKGTVSINGGTAGTTATKVVYYDQGTTTLSLTASAKDHYTFAGWYSDSSCTTRLTTSTTYSYTVSDKANDGKTFYAKFVADPAYDVTLSAVTYSNTDVKQANGFSGGTIDGNTSSYTVSVYKNDKVTAKAEPIDNYKFDGWYYDEACQKPAYISANLSLTITEPMTLYAKFKEKPKHTITVSSVTIPSETGGTVTVGGSTATYTYYEDSTTTIKATASAGYRFAGWYKDAACTGDQYNSSTSASVTIGTSDETYYAKFIKQCTVTLTPVLNGAESNSVSSSLKISTSSTSNEVNTSSVSLTVDYGTSVTFTAEPASGYVFGGFYTNISATMLASNPMQIDNDTTVYANFTKKPESVTTIYFAERDGYSSYYAHVYNSATESKNYTQQNGWPGDQATLDNATGYYKYTFTTEDTGKFRVIVSNNGSSQYPGDKGLEGDIGGTYLFKAGNPTELEPYDPSSTDETTITIYLTNSKSWDIVNCYYWGDDSSVSWPSWPGSAMTISYQNDYKQDVYMIKIPSSSKGIIFNNGSGDGSVQTVDITGFSDGTKYYITEEKDGDKWKVATW